MSAAVNTVPEYAKCAAAAREPPVVVEGQAAATTNNVIEVDAAELGKQPSAEGVPIATAPAISGNALEDDT